MDWMAPVSERKMKRSRLSHGTIRGWISQREKEMANSPELFLLKIVARRLRAGENDGTARPKRTPVRQKGERKELGCENRLHDRLPCLAVKLSGWFSSTIPRRIAAMAATAAANQGVS